MRTGWTTACLTVAAAIAIGCGREESSPTVSNDQTRVALTPFGQTPDGKTIEIVTLRHPSGIEARVVTYGGTILSLKTPDRSGALDDVVLGFDEMTPYFTKSPYFGCIIGRYCNRIAKGRFTLDGQTYQLATNDGPNHLHGGARGWDKVLWAATPFNDERGSGVELKYTSPDGDEHYPGTVSASVTYTLNPAGDLVVDYKATTDKPTIINLTQHSYFNLAGAKANDILNHELTIDAAQYTPIDATLIPTGTLAPVEGTPFDFRASTPIGARINAADQQLQYGKGYDHNFVLTKSSPGALTEAARVVDPATGRTLTISTTEPGIQFYSGNFLDGTITGKGGRVYGHRAAFCLEPQHFPDSPNQPNFPSTVLRPGQEYRSQTVYKFGKK